MSDDMSRDKDIGTLESPLRDAVERRLSDAYEKLVVARGILKREVRGSTHWEGCEDSHWFCRAIRTLDRAIVALEDDLD